MAEAQTANPCIEPHEVSARADASGAPGPDLRSIPVE